MRCAAAWLLAALCVANFIATRLGGLTWRSARPVSMMHIIHHLAPRTNATRAVHAALAPAEGTDADGGDYRIDHNAF